MAMTDPFTPSAFTLTSLTAAINKLPYQPQRLAALRLFEEQGVTTRMVAIDEQDGVLSLLDIKPVGADGTPVGGSGRTARPFVIPHIPARATLLADSFQGVRAFGSESQAEVMTVMLNERLAEMRRSIEYTLEAHRVAALKGITYDAAGNTIDLFAAFGVSQQSQALGLHTTNRSQIRQKMFTVRNKVRTALGGTPMSGLTVLCGDDFWSALLEDKDTRDTYLNQVQAAELRGNPADSFTAFGATWEHYAGTTDANFGSDAYAIPSGVQGLCITRFAPANYNEAINTIGLPMYVKSEPLKFGKGYELEAQSNPLNLVTRPAAVIKLTIA